MGGAECGRAVSQAVVRAVIVGAMIAPVRRRARIQHRRWISFAECPVSPLHVHSATLRSYFSIVKFAVRQAVLAPVESVACASSS